MDRIEARDRVRQLVADLEYERGADHAAAIIAALEAPPDHAPELSEVAGRPRILRLRGMFHTITVQETPNMLGAYLLSLRPSPSGWLSQADVRQIVTFLAGPARVLPDPAGGCSCTGTSEDRGGGYLEHMLEYDPACPEHSTHLYDPRTGSWVNGPEPVWSYTPEGHDDTYEYVTTADCDGSDVKRWRRTPERRLVIPMGRQERVETFPPPSTRALVDPVLDEQVRS